MKILHLSDIHAKGSNLAEINKVCSFIVDQARKENPDLIIHAGDTFDRSDIDLDSQAVKFMFWFFSALADVAPVSIIIGTKSHDGSASSVFEHIRAAFPIHVSDMPEQVLLFQGEFLDPPGPFRPDWTARPDAILSILPAPTKKFFQTESSIQVGETEIARGITKILAGFGVTAAEYDCPHILSGHFNVSGAFVSGTQTLTGVDIEVSRQQIDMGNFDLVCLGHIHKAQQIGDNIFFAGAVSNNTWGEMDTKGFYLHNTVPKGQARILQDSFFIETPTTKMFDLSYDFTDGNVDISPILAAKLSKGPSKVRLRIKVFVDEVEQLDIPGIEMFFRAEDAELTLEIIRMPRGNVRSARIQDLEGLGEKIIETAKILGEQVPSGVLEKAERLEEGDTEALLDEVRSL